MRDPSRPARPVILFLDAFSRMAYASIIATTSSQQVLKHLDAALLHFGGKYRKFASDRGMERDKKKSLKRRLKKAAFLKGQAMLTTRCLEFQGQNS